MVLVIVTVTSNGYKLIKIGIIHNNIQSLLDLRRQNKKLTFLYCPIINFMTIFKTI